MPRPIVHPPGALITVIMLSASLFACTSQTVDAPGIPRTAPSATSAKKARPRINAARLAKAVHERINRERRRQGLPTYRWDAALGRIAGKHSRDMARRNYFGHLSPEGRGPAQRYLRDHYACGVTIDGVLKSGAEVILRLPGADVRSDGAGGRSVLSGTAGAVVDGWLGSDPDRKELLSPHWQREGVGVFVAPDGTLYVTVNFC